MFKNKFEALPIDHYEIETFWYIDKDGKIEYDEDVILAWLLLKEYVFLNTYKVDNDQWTTVVYANCNDVFAWACADAETIDNDELIELFLELKKDPKWGERIWVCKKRNLQPQSPIKRDMLQDKAWTDEMEKLRKNKN